MDLTGLPDLTNSTITNTYNKLKRDELKTNEFQSRLEEASKEGDSKELREACSEFESYFLQMTFRAMRQTVDSSGGALPKSRAEEIFQDMLDEETCKVAAQGKGVGIAEMLYKQLSRQKL